LANKTQVPVLERHCTLQFVPLLLFTLTKLKITSKASQFEFIQSNVTSVPKAILKNDFHQWMLESDVSATVTTESRSQFRAICFHGICAVM
jgi:hypothetical protein